MLAKARNDMADTPTGETATPQVLENNTNGSGTVTPPAPAVVEEPKTEDSVVAQLRKEKEQAEMRANQLANQLKSREEAEAEAKAKELEEQNKFKELYEQERAKREAIESETEKREREAELQKTRETVLADFSDEVKTLAQEAGMELTDTADDSVAAFKEKLTKISKMVGNGGKVAGNNPAPKTTVSELNGEELRDVLHDEQAFHDLVTSKFPGIASMTNPRQ